jgi:hypothetical protein
VKRQVDAIAKPSRDSVVVGWCLDYELNGSDRFAENYWDTPEWIHTIDLANVSVAYLESTVSPDWHTTDQDYYPRKRAWRVIKSVYRDQLDVLGLSEETLDNKGVTAIAGSWYAAYMVAGNDAPFTAMTWDAIEEFRVACVAGLRAAAKGDDDDEEASDGGDASDVPESQ